jgi:hypothetical protein
VYIRSTKPSCSTPTTSQQTKSGLVGYAIKDADEELYGEAPVEETYGWIRDKID